MSGAELREDGRRGDLVVLMHGGSAGRSPWAETSRAWSQVGRSLEASGYRVLAADRPGHGTRSATSIEDLTYESECVALADLIAQNGGSAHLVGHAEAGTTALLMARREMQDRFGVHVRSCTVIGGYGAEPTGDAPERVVLKHPPAPRWSAPSQRWAVRRLTFSGDMADDLYDDTTAAESARTAARLVVAPGGAERLSGDLLKAKGEIFAYARDQDYDVPISLVWGMHDPLSEPARAVELMNLLATTRAHLELNLVDRAGHFVHRERPDELLRLLTGFLSGGHDHE